MTIYGNINSHGGFWLSANRGQLFVTVLPQRDVDVGFIERVVFCCSFSFTFPFFIFFNIQWLSSPLGGGNALTNPMITTRACRVKKRFMCRAEDFMRVWRGELSSTVSFLNGQIECFSKPLLLLTSFISTLLSYLMCTWTPCSKEDL